jgi:hypothetical protein
LLVYFFLSSNNALTNSSFATFISALPFVARDTYSPAIFNTSLTTNGEMENPVFCNFSISGFNMGIRPSCFALSKMPSVPILGMFS